MCCTHNNSNIYTPSRGKYYLVQYSRGDSLITHAVVKRNEICWPMGDLNEQQRVLIKDGRYRRLGIVLYFHEWKNRVQLELKSLKALCFEEYFEDPKQICNTKKDVWMLVQYSRTRSSVVYAIVKESSEIYYDRTNRDIFLSILNDESVYRAIIIKKSLCRLELVYKLRNIRLHCLEQSTFPLSNCFNKVAERVFHLRNSIDIVTEHMHLLNSIDDERYVKMNSILFHIIQYIRTVYKIKMDRLNLKILRELDILNLNPQKITR